MYRLVPAAPLFVAVLFGGCVAAHGAPLDDAGDTAATDARCSTFRGLFSPFVAIWGGAHDTTENWYYHREGDQLMDLRERQPVEMEVSFSWPSDPGTPRVRVGLGLIENNVMVEGWREGTSPITISLDRETLELYGPGRYIPEARSPAGPWIATLSFQTEIEWNAQVCSRPGQETEPPTNATSAAGASHSVLPFVASWNTAAS